MNPAAPKSHPKRAKAGTARKTTAALKFWIRSSSRELDRTGNFILKNLPSIRREAASRAGIA